MLKRDVLHSLNASGMHVDCSVADGLNSANADVGNAKRAKPSAAITLLLMVFMTFPCVSMASRQRSVGVMGYPTMNCCDAGHKKGQSGEAPAGGGGKNC